MTKSELQAVYREVKRNRNRRKKVSEKQPNQGCSTCGRVTWKPY